MEINSFAQFKTQDGRILFARIIGIGQRIVTLKAIGLCTNHRVCRDHVAILVFHPSLEEMARRNKEAIFMVEAVRNAKKARKEARRRRMIDLECDTTVDRDCYRYVDDCR